MLQEKVVFITGGASGIGYSIGKTCGENGAHIVISDIDSTMAAAASAKLCEQGIICSSIGCDVAVEAEIIRGLDFAYKEFGRIDILVNNAGLQHIALLEDFPTETFEHMIRIMLTAPFIATKYVLPEMKRQKYGRIINMASINGVIGFAGKAAYNSAKHGLIGLTKVAALESAAFGITVNALCPGYVDTPLVRNQLEVLAENRQVAIDKVLEDVIYPLVPQRRLLSVDEVADYAVFLASDKAKGITGQAVIIDGGYTVQ